MLPITDYRFAATPPPPPPLPASRRARDLQPAVFSASHEALFFALQLMPLRHATWLLRY
jgi:hypothetical protein